MKRVFRSLLGWVIVAGLASGLARAADPALAPAPGRAREPTPVTQAARAGAPESKPASGNTPAPAVSPTPKPAPAARSRPTASPAARAKPAPAPAAVGPTPTPEAVIRAAKTPTPAGTPTPAETPTPSPTPCVGKFSCVPPEESIELVEGLWVRPGTMRSFTFDLVDSYGAGDVTIPVTIIRGERPGPTLLLTSGIHGDELNGLPVLLKLRERIDPKELSGLVIMLPVVNPYGFQRQTRYLPDRRDLNRYFPGNPRGSLANRVAHRIFQTFVLPSDYLIDFHTAAGNRANAPHVRADPSSPAARELAQGFGGIVVLHGAPERTLRHAATAAGVPTAVFEGGENGRLDPKSIETGVRGVQNVLASLGMLSEGERRGAKPLWMTYSPWIRANTGGIVELAVGLGDLVQENELLLTIRDTLKGQKTEVRAPSPGLVMSLARSPVAEPGYALLRIGIIEREEKEPDAVAEPSAEQETEAEEEAPE